MEHLNAHGIPGVGIDAGGARHAQWRERACGDRLHSANALHLPFADGSFDVVLSSGLIEHIGVQEQNEPRYSVQRLPDCDMQRRQFVRELVRVVRTDGFILLDHPNGGSPADFWHGGTPGSIRWHRLRGDMLPRFDEISSYFTQADPHLNLLSISPSQRLSFRKSRNHWFGIAFAPVAKTLFQVMDLPSLSFLSRSPLNPYLITIASREPNLSRWANARATDQS